LLQQMRSFPWEAKTDSYPKEPPIPDLDFKVEHAEVLEFAAVPSILFKLRIGNLEEEPIRAVALNTQIRIAATQRHYEPAEQERLLEIFGEPHRWGHTLRSLLWTHTTLQVPRFSGSTVVDMPVPCTYDLEVVASKYFYALEEGEVPLEFLFSGTVFYAVEGGWLQTARISWEKEAEFRLPVRVWKEMMEHYFPNSAWIRLRRDAFDRLYNYKVRGGFPSWESTVEALLHASEQEVEP
jgi:Family of unknown function (DUF6084)